MQSIEEVGVSRGDRGENETAAAKQSHANSVNQSSVAFICPHSKSVSCSGWLNTNVQVAV